MIKEAIQRAFNEQIKKELDSAYLYLSMAAYFDSQNLEGMAHWMKLQAKEEFKHAMKFYEHINERGGRVELFSLEEPVKEWTGPFEVFKHVYEHEQRVTASIYNLVELSKKENDHAAYNFLQWFVNEQIEEESNASKILQTIEKIKDSPVGIIMMDRELAKRE
ncbi:MAG TPA: ferritin [Pseudothermotoga sp.]